MNLHNHNVKKNGKKLIFNIFNHKSVDRTPWIPFAGAHAAKLKNYSAEEIFKDEEKYLDSLRAVNKHYQPDGQPIMFDLQIEAEILGCNLKWHEKGPPSVASHPLENSDEIPTHLPTKDEGRLPFFLDVMKRFIEEFGDSTATIGLLCGPLTLAAHLRGTKFFIDLLRNKQYAKDLLEYAKLVGLKIAEYYVEAGMDIIAVVDPVVSQISPRIFKKFLTDPFTELFDFIKDHNKLSSFFVCGDATNNLELMCKTNTDSIFVDENIDMNVAMKILKKYDVILGGNIPLTTVLLYGTQQDNMKYVLDLIDKVGQDNLILAPGCDMPYDIPLDNVVGVLQAIQEPEIIRKTLETYKSSEIEIDVDLPDYANLDKPILEVFTIDSEICPACGYLKGAGLAVKNALGDKINFCENKITESINIAKMKKLGIEHVPALLINGEVKYSSIIPDIDKLIKEVKKEVAILDKKSKKKLKKKIEKN